MPEVYINIPQLVALTGARRLTADGDNVYEVLASLETSFPGFGRGLLGDDGRFRGHIMVIGRYGSRSEKEIIGDPGDPRRELRELAILPVSCGG